jgi:hypothetical protein
LPNGQALLRFTDLTVDRGHKLAITYWALARAIPPQHAHIANFSYTILEQQQDDPVVQEEIRMLDREIRAAVITSQHE